MLRSPSNPPTLAGAFGRRGCQGGRRGGACQDQAKGQRVDARTTGVAPRPLLPAPAGLEGWPNPLPLHRDGWRAVSWSFWSPPSGGGADAPVPLQSPFGVRLVWDNHPQPPGTPTPPVCPLASQRGGMWEGGPWGGWAGVGRFGCGTHCGEPPPVAPLSGRPASASQGLTLGNPTSHHPTVWGRVVPGGGKGLGPQPGGCGTLVPRRSAPSSSPRP